MFIEYLTFVCVMVYGSIWVHADAYRCIRLPNLVPGPNLILGPSLILGPNLVLGPDLILVPNLILGPTLIPTRGSGG